jgi:methyl-accepting chemotaxis protein
MNQYIILFLVTIGTIPPAYFILKAIFGKSVMLAVGIWTVGFVHICSWLHFVAGIPAISFFFLVTPLALVIGALIYFFLNKILKLPLNQLIINVKQVSVGDFAIEMNESIIKNVSVRAKGLLLFSIQQNRIE